MDKNQTDPILEEDLLADIDLEIDAVIKEEIKKAAYKTKPVKLDMSDINWEHKTMNKSYNYTFEESMSHKVTEQINGLWQKIKTMESNLKYYSDALELQNKIIRSLEEQIKAQQNDNIVEINDRLDDIESRLNLIDE
jgi:predicted  nucleic acid-binding Zn-ribbon protein